MKCQPSGDHPDGGRPSVRDRAVRASYHGHPIVFVRNLRLMAHGTDLSATGMLLQVPTDVPGAKFIRLQFPLAPDQGWIDTDALCVREVLLPDGRLWGVKFLQLTTAQNLALRSFVLKEYLEEIRSSAPARRSPAAPKKLEPSPVDENAVMHAEIRRLIEEAARAVEAPPPNMKPTRGRPII
jgi:hypothetical protein